MLIKRVYEMDPLGCPECGGEMKVVSFIEPPQADVIEDQALVASRGRQLFLAKLRLELNALAGRQRLQSFVPARCFLRSPCEPGTIPLSNTLDN